MWDLSIDAILAIDSNSEEGEEEYNDEEEKYEEEMKMKEGEISSSHHPIFCTTGTNTNPFP